MCLEKRGLRGEDIYNQTQNDTRKGASNDNVKLFAETGVEERSAIYSDTE
jgi:hypothetical protein